MLHCFEKMQFDLEFNSMFIYREIGDAGCMMKTNVTYHREGRIVFKPQCFAIRFRHVYCSSSSYNVNFPVKKSSNHNIL